MAKRVVVENIKGRDSKRFGMVNPGPVAEGHHAEIVVGESIRLHGIEKNRTDGPAPYDITFKVGETAVYGSYNLVYTGKILAIGEKTVTIQECGDRVSRLALYDFSWRNRDYNADKIREMNAETSRCI